jgi:hypothetical protein
MEEMREIGQKILPHLPHLQKLSQEQPLMTAPASVSLRAFRLLRNYNSPLSESHRLFFPLRECSQNQLVEMGEIGEKILPHLPHLPTRFALPLRYHLPHLQKLSQDQPLMTAPASVSLRAFRLLRNYNSPL